MAKVYNDNFYTGFIDLANYIDSQIVELPNSNGDLQKGIFIPFGVNDIKTYQGKYRVVCKAQFFINRTYNNPKNDFVIVQRYTLAGSKYMEDMGYKPLILGSGKSYGFNTRKDIEDSI